MRSIGDPALADVATLTARYDIQGVSLVVRSNDPEAMGHVHDTYGWFAVDPETATEPPIGARLTVALLREPDGTATVIDGAGRSTRWEARNEPVVALFDAIVSGLISALSSEGLLAIHSGVVAQRGRAILVAGRSGRGKTTLVLGLLRRGLDLLSDELTLIGPDQRTVLAYPRGLHVRPESLGLFPELGFLRQIEPHELGGGSEWSVAPAALQRAFGTRVAETARVGVVVLLDGDPVPDASPRLEPVAGAIAAMELLRGTPAAAWDFDGVLTRMPLLLSEVPCARLRSARLEDTVDAVLAFAGLEPRSER
jgi:hypothetical protein